MDISIIHLLRKILNLVIVGTRMITMSMIIRINIVIMMIRICSGKGFLVLLKSLSH